MGELRDYDFNQWELFRKEYEKHLLNNRLIEERNAYWILQGIYEDLKIYNRILEKIRTCSTADQEEKEKGTRALSTYQFVMKWRK